MATKAVSTVEATLLRGRVYFYKDIEFKRGVPVEVDDTIAQELESIVDNVRDSDGVIHDKPFFKINWRTEAGRNNKLKSAQKTASSFSKKPIAFVPKKRPATRGA